MLKKKSTLGYEVKLSYSLYYLKHGQITKHIVDNTDYGNGDDTCDFSRLTKEELRYQISMLFGGF